MKRDLNYFLNKTTLNNTCLEWAGCYNTDGYPRIFWNKSSNGKLHRIIWELANKKDPTGHVIRHTCDNIRCINPQHLQIGTATENIQDRTLRDRAHGLKQKDIQTIKTLFYSKTYTAKELSSLFNVSLRTIYYSLKRK